VLKDGMMTSTKCLLYSLYYMGAEMNFKKMLHHNPEHGACNYMLGLVYLSKNHTQEGIKHVEKALEKTPWHTEWRENLIKAYDLVGETEKSSALKEKYKKGRTADGLELEAEEEVVEGFGQ